MINASLPQFHNACHCGHHFVQVAVHTQPPPGLPACPCSSDLNQAWAEPVNALGAPGSTASGFTLPDVGWILSRVVMTSVSLARLRRSSDLLSPRQGAGHVAERVSDAVNGRAGSELPPQTAHSAHDVVQQSDWPLPLPAALVRPPAEQQSSQTTGPH